jgi:hypothetical protein
LQGAIETSDTGQGQDAGPAGSESVIGNIQFGTDHTGEIVVALNYRRQ